MLSNEEFTDEAVHYAYRAFTSLLIGHLLLEAGPGPRRTRRSTRSAPSRCRRTPRTRTRPTGPTGRRRPAIGRRDDCIAGAALDDATADSPPGLPIGRRSQPTSSSTCSRRGFAVRLAEDHAEQEVTYGLHVLLERLAAHPGSVPDS